MPMYHILNNERRLQPFRSIEFGSQYQERELEDWLEANPQVLVGDEPLLVIGRQVNTPAGIIDLLALDADGVGVIVELKRAPSQREAIAQALKYVAWLADLDADAIHPIAEDYLARKAPSLSFNQAWQQTFNSDLSSVLLNSHQSIFIVIEGENERILSIVRYLRNSGVDINLLSYSYYRTESGEEILDIERQVGREALVPATSTASAIRPTEDVVVRGWTGDVGQAYAAFRERLTSIGLIVKPKKSGISFYKQTRDELVFICFVTASPSDISVWLRADSLQLRFDFQSVAESIRRAIPTNVQVVHKPVWFILTSSVVRENIIQIAEIIISEVVERVE